jgi:hypothetical protein
VDSNTISDPHFANAIFKAIELGYCALKAHPFRLQKDNMDHLILFDEGVDEGKHNLMAYDSGALCAELKETLTSTTHV